MYIDTIVLDGFKSYAQRTQLGPLDPHFNAITGLNGAGKSNILDAICFVLGSNAWSQLRVSSPIELIYKHASTSVKRAAVTIHFDNRDKDRSPAQYVHFDKIVLMRQIDANTKILKYKLNGRAVQVGDVQNFLHSVQLNILNPHFLVMQGRITNVLNYSHAQLLGLLEEASGTRMFESKKIAVRKRIDGHEAKVSAILKILEKTIKPTLDRLKRDKCLYVEYLELNGQLHQKERDLVTYQAARAMDRLQRIDLKISQFKDERNKVEKCLVDTERQLEKVQFDLDDARKRTSEDEFIRGINDQIDQHSMRLKVLQLEMDQLNHQLQDQTHRIESLSREHQRVTLEISQLKIRFQAQEDLTKESQMRLELILQKRSMVNADDGHFEHANDDKLIHQRMLNLQEQQQHIQSQLLLLMGFHSQQITSITFNQFLIHLEDYVMLFNHLLEPCHIWAKKASAPTLVLLQDQIQTIIMAMTSNRVDDPSQKLSLTSSPQEQRLLYQLYSLEDPDLKSQILSARLKLHGRCCQLCKPIDSQDALALSVAASSRWLHVVVDSSSDAHELSKLVHQRTTYVMLDQLRMFRHSKKLQSALNTTLTAEQIKHLRPAIDLLEPTERGRCLSSEDFMDMLYHVLSETLIATDDQIAKHVAFKMKIARVVTRRGDVYETKGWLTGGSQSESAPPILNIARQHIHPSHIRHLHDTRDHQRKLSRLQALHTKITDLNHVMAGLYDLEQSLQNMMMMTRRSESHRNNASIEQDLFQDDHDDHIENARQVVEDHRKYSREVHANLIQSNRECDRINDQIQCIYKDRENTQHLIEKTTKQLQDVENLLTQLQIQLENITIQQRQHDQQLSNLTLERDRIQQRQHDLHQRLDTLIHILDKKTLDQARERHVLQSARASVHVHELNDWLQRRHRPDLGNAQLSALQSDIEANRHRLTTLRALVNTKSLQLFDQFQRQCEDLKQKMAIIQADRDAIESTIQELDQKKAVTLHEAFQQLQNDFTAIFCHLNSTLKPELKPVYNNTHPTMVGFQIIATIQNNVAHLHELSGGQRSLLALSLILALLKYNPAPMYILDEIDAALDHTNTQRIGHILKQQFPKSQFILISLKDTLIQSASQVFTASFDASRQRSTITKMVARYDDVA